MSGAVQIAGNCPMGCGESLFLGAGGCITCSRIDCPRPTAVDELLAERESEHIVVFTPTNFSIQHPLHERLDGALFDCELHGWISRLSGPPVVSGRYRATRQGLGDWHFEEASA
jgi:hypothetical protein